MTKFERRFESYRKAAEEAVQNYCEDVCLIPNVLQESVKYALSGGGKRIRPILTLAVGDMLGADRERLMPLALSIELIHNYSLVHDDIMDGDDFRRGKPTVQKKFGTANALLAGDALLNDAHTMLLNHCVDYPKDAPACCVISSAAGGEGMIGGQSADLQYERDEMSDYRALDFIYENKTAKLISAACEVPALVAGKNPNMLHDFGISLGKLFQLTDDILDCGDSGSDAKRKKLTAVSLYGIDESEKMKEEYAQDALKWLDYVYDADTSFLRDFVLYVRDRKA